MGTRSSVVSSQRSAASERERARASPLLRRFWDAPPVADPPRRVPSDWAIATLTVLIGAWEATTDGLGWPALRLVAALAIAGLLFWRRSAPLVVFAAVAGINLAASIALEAAGHFLLMSGLMLVVAIHALVRWASSREIAIGLGLVAVHAIVGYFVNPNWSLIGALLFYVTPVLLALAVRPVEQQVGANAARAGLVLVAAVAVFVVTAGSFAVNQVHSYITRTRSPAAPAEWHVDAAILRQAAESSRGTHDDDGAIIHTVNYPFQMLDALERSTYSVEADVTVIDGEGFLQHDPREAVGMPLLDFLEYAAIAEFPIVKLDFKCDRVGPIIDEVHQAVEEFGLDPTRVQFNANVLRGPGVEENVIGGRKDLSATDSIYNLVVMELETSDLVRIAEEFPESKIVISAATPKGDSELGYTDDHLEQFVAAVDEVREASPSQGIVFALRGDLAANSDPSFLDGLTVIDDSYVAAWWSADVPPVEGEVRLLLERGVQFIDPGEEVEV